MILEVEGKIIENRARCRRCSSTLVSNYPWDYVVCECGAISINGGRERLIRNFGEKIDVIELSVIKE